MDNRQQFTDLRSPETLEKNRLKKNKTILTYTELKIQKEKTKRTILNHDKGKKCIILKVMTDLPSTSLQQQDKEDCNVLEGNHCLSSVLYSEENIQK